jgi:paraquat-inducible protein B
LSETIDRDNLPRATLTPSRRSRISAVWLIPLLAAVVAIGIAVHRILNEGPTISIVFKSAEGVEAGKTSIRYKDVKIGEVTALELYENYSKVMVTAQIDKHAEGLMVEDAEFWVVHPRVTLSGISGLSTLLSGNYIGFARGKSKKTQHRFTGLETAPVVAIDQAGRAFQLTADDLGSLGIGSPVYFRRLNVGQLIAYDLAADGEDVTIRIFVTAPYDRFVTTGTRFWNASGLDVSLGTGGVDVRTESLVSLLIGGVAFETPAFAATSEPAAAGTAFVLYKDRATAMKQPEAIARHYVAYFDDSMRGLSVGAPVTLLGLPAGEVTDVGIDLDPKTLSLHGRVEIVTYPDRVVARLQSAQTATGKDIVRSEQRSRAFFQRLIEERGLRAQLRSGSLITGQLYVAFDFFPDAEKAQIDWTQETPVVPTVPATLPNLEAKITGVLAKLDKVPYEAIGIDIKRTIETLDKAIEDIASGINPALQSAIAELRRALASANRVLKDTGATLLGKDAPGQLELRGALQEVARAARSVRVLSDYLERHPGALLRGKSGEKP